MEKKVETTKNSYNLKLRNSLPENEAKLYGFGSNITPSNTHSIKATKVYLKENMLYFDKNLKENIKFPRGYWKMKRE